MCHQNPYLSIEENEHCLRGLEEHFPDITSIVHGILMDNHDSNHFKLMQIFYSIL